MATFVKISNGTVAQFNVLFIFVMAWCWFNATNLSRETLWASLTEHGEFNNLMQQMINFIFVELWKNYAGD